RIHAVDANPRQIALLELKLAGIRRLAYADFFGLFGQGHHRAARELYFDCMRTEMSDFARAYWDRNIGWFARSPGSFYFHGLSGVVARTFRGYLRLRPSLAAPILDLFEAGSVEQQRDIYDTRIQPLMWGRGMNWALSRQFTMSLLGVPYPQRRE